MIDVLAVGMDVGTLMRVVSLLGAQGLAVKSRQVTEGEWVTALVLQAAAARPKLVIVDLSLRFGESALDFLRQLLGGQERLIVLLLVTLGQENFVTRANQLREMPNQVVDFRIKPFEDDAFVSQVKTLLGEAVCS